MDAVITTPVGYVTVKDERIKENVEMAYAQFFVPRNIEEKKIGDAALCNCKVKTPFGYSCVRSYESVCNSESAVNKIFKGKVARDIVFVEIF